MAREVGIVLSFHGDHAGTNPGGFLKTQYPKKIVYPLHIFLSMW